MPLAKQGYNINFGQGIDTKTDPNTVPVSKMLRLQNTVFGSGASIQKRNGFGRLTALPDATSTTLTTLNGNLLATGSSLQAYSADISAWVNRGTLKPSTVAVQPLVRTSASQINSDSVTASNGLVCTVYTDSLGNSYYSVNDSVTGQVVVAVTQLRATAVVPKVVVFGNFFIVSYIATVTATSHLQFISIPIANPSNAGSIVNVSSALFSLSAAYDVTVNAGSMFFAWYSSDVAPTALYIVSVSSALSVIASNLTASTTEVASMLRLCVDSSNNIPVVWMTWYDSAAVKTYAKAYTYVSSVGFVVLLAKTEIASIATTQFSTVATAGVMTLVYEVTSSYASPASARSDYLMYRTVANAGTLGTATQVSRSVGLASRIFYYNSVIYMLAVYAGTYQPTLFLLDLNGNIISRLAGANAAGYVTSSTLPSVSIIGTNITVSYLFKTLIQSVNKSQGVANVAGIYAQTGINLAAFTINISQQYNSEIASTLQLTGGQLWLYDAVKPVELGFHVYPEDAALAMSNGAGALIAQQYYYQICYEWTDAQGNLHRSAPSIPLGALIVGPNNTVAITIPTLRLTYKSAANPVRIVVYRWSTAQQNYYQVTSIASPTLNNATVDAIVFTDLLADSAILGNTLLYTTGGVIENIIPPPSVHSALFGSRLWLINAENRNQLWFSKQVLAGTPVEMSDLLTRYVPPTLGSQGSTGPLTALAAMDDKLIMFKQNSIYYMTGTGPDNTGANSDFSQPIFISSAVGCSNPNSIVLTQNGIMFQSDKGIWLLGRDLSTQYVGADVEAYNAVSVKSAISVPGTNQIRFVLDSGIILMYDYYYNQWGTFVGAPAISSTLYNGYHTLLNSFGIVSQETPGVYLDNSSPVLISFTTSWIKLNGLQGFQRAYCMYLLATYISPHKLSVQIAYDYSLTGAQNTVIQPTNISSLYGSGSLYGSDNPYGGGSALEQWRVFFSKQKCQSIQISVVESYDNSKGVAAGAGFSMSGINLLLGAKATTPKVSAANSAS